MELKEKLLAELEKVEEIKLYYCGRCGNRMTDVVPCYRCEEQIMEREPKVFIERGKVISTIISQLKGKVIVNVKDLLTVDELNSIWFSIEYGRRDNLKSNVVTKLEILTRKESV